MSRWFLGLAALGLAASSASTWVHYRLINDPTYVSVCDVNSTFSCSEAYTSPYGSVAGVPVALLGMLFFLSVIGLVALCSRSESAARNLAGYLFAASTVGLAVVIYLGYASYVILDRLPAVREHVRRRHRAVPDVGGAATDPMPAFPVSLAMFDPAAHASRPVRGRALRRRGRRPSCCFRAARSPRRWTMPPGRRRPRRCQPPTPRACGVRAVARDAAARTARRADRRGDRRDREVQRLPVPGLRADATWTTSRSSRSGRSTPPAR